MDERCAGQIVVDEGWKSAQGPESEGKEDELGTVHEIYCYDLFGCNVVGVVQPACVSKHHLIGLLECPGSRLVNKERLVRRFIRFGVFFQHTECIEFPFFLERGSTSAGSGSCRDCSPVIVNGPSSVKIGKRGYGRWRSER